jgi:hypothetical protein
MTETVWLSMIAACSGIFTAAIAPVIVMVVTSRTRRLEKEEEWHRQDEVARRLVNSNQEIAAHAVQTARDVNFKLDKASAERAVIHTLVNSTLTEAKRSELRALKAQARLMEEMRDFRLSLTPPIGITEEGQTDLDNIHRQIDVLQKLLVARDEAAALVGKQLDEQKAEGVGPN